VVAVSASDEETAAYERAMVLRYCTRVTGDRGTAEDLTQQALLEAWQKSAHPHSATVREAWLRGVARNVCLRWARGRGSTAARLVRLAEPWGEVDGRLAGDINLEAEFERADLARLLERAMALVPPETREVLVQKYIEEIPQAEVAARLGLSEGAVEARLARGKRALRRLFTTTLAADARSYGLISPDDVGWRETRIWCPDCGQRRLVGRFTDGHDLQLDCPDCLGQGRVIQVRGWILDLLGTGSTSTHLLEGVTAFKPALNRITARLSEVYQQGIAGRAARCPWCGHEAPLRISPTILGGNRDVGTDCSQCGRAHGLGTVSAIASLTPRSQAFQRQHGRIRTLPLVEVEAGGVPALVTRFESVTAQAVLEVIVARDTLEVISVPRQAAAR